MTQRRNRRSGVEDRWIKTVRDADGSLRSEPSANHGKGLRYRARYVDDDNREHAKGFALKKDAQKWLDTEVTAKFATGTYVEPSAGRVTVSSVYQSWFPAQSHISAQAKATRRSAWNRHVEPHWGLSLIHI